MIFSKRLSGLVVLSAALAYVPTLAAENDAYLALGDSVSFGLNLNLLPPIATTVPLPSAFTGYPELVAQFERWQSSKIVNASCPGETSGSFLKVTVPDDGCNSSHVQPGPPPPPFKTSIGLKASYTDAQMAFALRELAANKKIQLVTISIGANDFLLINSQCALLYPNDPAGQAGCVGPQVPGMLATYAGNLAQILQQIRSVYKGKLVLVTYYSPSPDFVPIALNLNGIMATVGAGFNATIANGFLAFQLASGLAGGDPCAAGLLTRLPDGTCDVHPSLAGQAVLAAAVEVAIHSR